MNDKETCAFCKYYTENAERQEQGVCHFSPPQVFMVMIPMKVGHALSPERTGTVVQPNFISKGPDVSANNFCGKFLPNLTAQS